MIDAVLLAGAVDPERHPTVGNVNAMLTKRLSTTETACRRIAAWTGAPIALLPRSCCS